MIRFASGVLNTAIVLGVLAMLAAAATPQETKMDTLTVAVVILVGICMYFAPVIVANIRHHRNENAIGILNLLLGWTFLGWVIALIWACTDNVHPTVKPLSDQQVINDLSRSGDYPKIDMGLRRHPKHPYDDQWEG